MNIFGGHDRFGKAAKVERKFVMPGHYRIKVKFTFVKINSWDNELGFCEIDGVRIWEAKLIHNQGPFHTICGTCCRT